MAPRCLRPDGGVDGVYGLAHVVQARGSQDYTWGEPAGAAVGEGADERVGAGLIAGADAGTSVNQI